MLISSGLQITAIVGGCVLVGHWLDGKYATTPWWTLAGSVVGIGSALYGFLSPLLRKS